MHESIQPWLASEPYLNPEPGIIAKQKDNHNPEHDRKKNS
jgi:hypothetical protein